jgi:hypothetical protein
MIEALIDGDPRGSVLADLVIGRMRAAGKLADLSMALAGRFTARHALLCRLHLCPWQHLESICTFTGTFPSLRNSAGSSSSTDSRGGACGRSSRDSPFRAKCIIAPLAPPPA